MQKEFRVIKFIFSVLLLAMILFCLFWAFACSELVIEQWGGIDEDVLLLGIVFAYFSMIITAIYYIANLGKRSSLIVSTLLFLANIHLLIKMEEIVKLAIIINGELSLFGG